MAATSTGCVWKISKSKKLQHEIQTAMPFGTAICIGEIIYSWKKEKVMEK